MSDIHPHAGESGEPAARARADAALLPPWGARERRSARRKLNVAAFFHLRSRPGPGIFTSQREAHGLCEPILPHMRSSLRCSRVRRPAAALLALLAAGALVPTRALAGCGDYLTPMPDHNVPAPNAVPSGEAPPAGDDSAAATLRRAGAEHHGHLAPPAPCGRCPHGPVAPGPRPCEGPWCSGNHRPMNVPTPTTSEAPHDSWAWCGLAARPGDPDSFTRAPRRETVARIHHVPPIERPPRSA